MASLNSCHIIGNVVRDPEGKTLPSGKAVCDFSLAINHAYTTESGEKREIVTYLDFTAFGRTAEIITQYAKKGKSLYVCARASVDQWDDKTTGAKRSKVKFIVDNMQLLGGGDGKGGQHQSAPVTAGNAPDDEDDIPF